MLQLRASSICVWPLAILLACGCSGEQQSNPDAGKPASSQSADGSKPVKGAAEPAANPADILPGKWTLWMSMLSQRPAEVPLLLIDFRKSPDGKLQGKSLESSPMMPDSSLALWNQKDDGLTLTISTPVGEFTFEGTLQDRVFTGNLQLQESQVAPARLVATTVSTLQGVRPVPLEGWDQFQELFEALEPQSFRKFASEHSHSALAMMAYNFVLNSSKDEKVSREELDKLGQQMVAAASYWGPRYGTLSEFRFGATLVQINYHPDLGFEYLERLEKRALPEGFDSMKRQIAIIRERASLPKVIENAKSTDDTVRKPALVELERLAKEYADDPMIQLDVASFYEESGQLDEAIARYGQLAVAPSMEHALAQLWQGADPQPELPSERVARLWTEKHGNAEGVRPYLDGLFHKLIADIADEAVPPRGPGDANKVVLCELFTGATCPPCVAPDVALGAIEATFPPSDVIALRYHQHIPMPSPLVSNDSEARFAYYELRGTPMLFLNGQTVSGAAGGFEFAAPLYEQLKKLASQLLSESTAISLKLSSEEKEGALSISATVDEAPQNTQNLRLRLVLAEEQISFPASNGIRLHEMVVRSMPGGPSGIAAVAGKFQYNGSIQLEDLRQRLLSHLASAEELNPSGPFLEKPLDLKKLHLIAFLQDDKTRNILQAASIRLPESKAAATGDASPGAKTSGPALVAPPLPAANQPESDQPAPPRLPE